MGKFSFVSVALQRESPREILQYMITIELWNYKNEQHEGAAAPPE